jgi:hypothetical protein
MFYIKCFLFQKFMNQLISFNTPLSQFFLCSIFRASWINLSRNNQQMSRHSTLFPFNSLHVSDTFCVHHQEINKINCICNLWYGNSIVRPAVVLTQPRRRRDISESDLGSQIHHMFRSTWFSNRHHSKTFLPLW